MITTLTSPWSIAELERQIEDNKRFWHFAGLRVLKGVPVTIYWDTFVRSGNIINVDYVHLFMATTFTKIAIKLTEINAVEVDQPEPSKNNEIA